MCGIVGILTNSETGRRSLEARLCRMNATLEHRGPDSDGRWVDEHAGIAIGHRRLSIVDLSETGHQPMLSSCSRLVITYNGEIYNAMELREDLRACGRCFRGSSDTEVLLEACSEWGIDRAVRKAIGMFAFAIWDRDSECLYLARDRLGIKPLFYGQIGDEFLFGSELKAIMAASNRVPDTDNGALHAYMRHGYVPTPNTIFEKLKKLEPGSILKFNSNREQCLEAFWKLDDVIQRERQRPFQATDEEAIDELEGLLGDAVRRRMIADVPLGAFLSGGIDSSTVVALMQSFSDRPVRTFSIGFSEGEYDEAKQAKAVARHLGTDHTELYVEPSHAFEVIPKLAEMYDEPFADSSQIPTFLVSELTRRHVTVSLSGDGGDELFAGYNRYLFGARLLERFGRVPRVLKKASARAIRQLRPATWTRLSSIIPHGIRPKLFGDKIYKLADLIGRGPEDVYRGLVSLWHTPGEVVLAGREPRTILWDPGRPAWLDTDVEWMQYLDTLTYLPDDILTKVDRASMAVSLEARVPLLDHRVVEFAWRLPERLKVRQGVSKWILRQILYKHVPQRLVDRPKMGFGVPIGHWLRGPLREWAESLLDERALSRGGILNSDPVRRMWHQHLGEEQNWQYPLWCVLMFQAWRAKWLS